MTSELIAIIAAAIALGGLMYTRLTAIDSRLAGLEARLRDVETELAFLRGLIQGGQPVAARSEE